MSHSESSNGADTQAESLAERSQVLSPYWVSGEGPRAPEFQNQKGIPRLRGHAQGVGTHAQGGAPGKTSPGRSRKGKGILREGGGRAPSES
jgi:hypothetical protein